MRSFFRGLIWVLFTCFFGMLQLFVQIAFEWLGNRTYSSWESICTTGGLLFFCTALTSSISIDYFCDEKEEVKKSVVGIFFVIVPVSIILASISLFVAAQPQFDGFCPDRARTLSIWTFILTCIHACVMKTYFYKD